MDKYLIDGPKQAQSTFLFAHGAGAAMDAEFMNVVAAGLAERKIRVVRFEFPYMAQRRLLGKKRPPDRMPILCQSWKDVVDEFRCKRLFVGGKSMGGRIASLVADEAEVDGLICFGYPFHPPGKPESLRTEHLMSLKTPSLILQGERDPFGNKTEVPGYRLPRRIKVKWLPDGDHGFKPRKASGKTLNDNLQAAINFAADFLTG